jgi:hypothetical protein
MDKMLLLNERICPMLVTPQQAADLWCPLARAKQPAADHVMTPGVNRDADGRPVWGARCISHSCMAWQTASSTHGYCGAFGKPETKPGEYQV